MIPLAEKSALILQEGQAFENLCTINNPLQRHQVLKAVKGKMKVKRTKWQDNLESGDAAKNTKNCWMQKKLS